MTTFAIEKRKVHTINTDPQRRCYSGCNASERHEWSPWSWLNLEVPEDEVDEKLTFWRELNDYAISQRGRSAKKQFRAVANEEGRALTALKFCINYK